MEWFYQAMVIAGMFVLRLGTPLLITIGIVYLLRWLDARWEAEARAEAEAEQKAVEIGKQIEKPLSIPVPQPSFTPQPALLDTYNQPCWDFKGCDPAQRESCPAAQQPGTPCWLARRRAEGAIPNDCYGCELFTEPQQPQSPQPVYH